MSLMELGRRIDLAKLVLDAQKRDAELLESANSIWLNQQMSTNVVAKNLMILIVDHCSESQKGRIGDEDKKEDLAL